MWLQGAVPCTIHNFDTTVDTSLLWDSRFVATNTHDNEVILPLWLVHRIYIGLNDSYHFDQFDSFSVFWNYANCPSQPLIPSGIAKINKIQKCLSKTGIEPDDAACHSTVNSYSDRSIDHFMVGKVLINKLNL